MHANPSLLFNWIYAWMCCKLLLEMDYRIDSSYGQQYNGTSTLGASSPPHHYFYIASKLILVAECATQMNSSNLREV